LEQQIEAAKTLGRETAALEAIQAGASAAAIECSKNLRDAQAEANEVARGGNHAALPPDRANREPMETALETASNTERTVPAGSAADPESPVTTNRAASAAAGKSVIPDARSVPGVARAADNAAEPSASTPAADARRQEDLQTGRSRPWESQPDRFGQARAQPRFQPDDDTPNIADSKQLRVTNDVQKRLLQQFELWAQTQGDLLRNMLNAMATLSGTQTAVEQKLKAILDEQAKLNARLRDRQNF
jgi:hypothetical protein